MDKQETIHKNIRIKGRVQGVGFRYAALKAADSMEIKGYVRNLPDGDVYIEAEGTSVQMNNFLLWCKEGPSLAKIQHMDIINGAVSGFNEFTVRY